VRSYSPPLGDEIARPCQERPVREFLLEDLLDPDLVTIVQERPEQVDGDRIDLVPSEFPSHVSDALLVEVDDHVTHAVDTFVHAVHPFSLYDRVGLARVTEAQHVFDALSFTHRGTARA